MNTIPNKRKFIDTYTFSERSTEATRILQKYNDRVPIICERNSKDITAPYIDKNKYLVPHDLTVGQFIYVIKKRLRMSPTEALFIFINGNVVSNSTLQRLSSCQLRAYKCGWRTRSRGVQQHTSS
jgi:hypothetical protein